VTLEENGQNNEKKRRNLQLLRREMAVTMMEMTLEMVVIRMTATHMKKKVRKNLPERRMSCTLPQGGRKQPKTPPRAPQKEDLLPGGVLSRRIPLLLRRRSCE
jgi:hypothetical protein